MPKTIRFTAMAALGACAILVSACQSCPCPKPADQPKAAAAEVKASDSQPPIVHPIPTWNLGQSRYTTPATIKAAAIEGHRLILTVEYTGTGKHHDITLLRDARFKESSPPQLDLYLNHTTTDSGGTSRLETIHFDLGPVKTDCLFHHPGAKALVLRIHDTANDDIFVPLPRYSW